MIKIILIIIIAICVTIIFDARRICEKYFSSSMKNKQVRALKIVGFIVAIICSIILSYIMWK